MRHPARLSRSLSQHVDVPIASHSSLEFTTIALKEPTPLRLAFGAVCKTCEYQQGATLISGRLDYPTRSDFDLPNDCIGSSSGHVRASRAAASMTRSPHWIISA